MDNFYGNADNRLANIETALKNFFRTGTVVGRDEKSLRVRVEFKDNDAIVSYWCQVLVPLAHSKKDYRLPPLGSVVGCIFLPFGQDMGYCMGSVYNAKDPIPSGADKDTVIFEDESGNREEWNSKTNQHSMKSGLHKIEGDVEITGNIRVTGTVTDVAGNLTTHTNEGMVRDVS